MRRLLRSAFLLLIVASLVAPLPASEATALSVPICCLPKGEHHCLGHEIGGSGAPGFSADNNECPYLPLALGAMHGPDLAPPVQTRVIASIGQCSAIIRESSEAFVSSVTDTRPERGPPSFSLN